MVYSLGGAEFAGPENDEPEIAISGNDGTVG